VQRIEGAAERVEPLRGHDQLARMTVIVDRRKFRGRLHVGVRDERRPRPIVENTWRREFGRLAAARTNLGHARRALLARLNCGAASATTAAAAAGLLSVEGKREREER